MMIFEVVILIVGVVVTSTFSQDIHLHLGGDTSGQGPDTGPGVVEGGQGQGQGQGKGGQDYVTDPNNFLRKKIKELNEKLKKCDQQGS